MTCHSPCVGGFQQHDKTCQAGAVAPAHSQAAMLEQDSAQALQASAQARSTFQYTQSARFDQATNTPVAARVDHRNAVQGPTLVNWVAAEITRPPTASR